MTSRTSLLSSMEDVSRFPMTRSGEVQSRTLTNNALNLVRMQTRLSTELCRWLVPRAPRQ